MNVPTPFTGKREKLDEFLMEVEMYHDMNPEIYNTDMRKIIFTLSYMRDGTAGPWKNSYWMTTKAQEQRPTWEGFKTALRESFTPQDVIGDAITKLETERMSGRTADEFNEEFKINMQNSKVQEDRPLIEWYMKGLNTPLLDRILNLENPPTTIRTWMTTAAKLDNQWRRGRAIANRLKGGNDLKKKGLRFPPKNQPRYMPPVRDPDAMDVD